MKPKKVLAIIEEIGSINTSGAIVNWNLCKILAPGFEIFNILTLDSISHELVNSWQYGSVFVHPKQNLNKFQKMILKIPKIRALAQLLIGNDFYHYNRIKNIRLFLDQNIHKYDEVLLLSGGGGFTPHHALNKSRYKDINKTAVFHDPYPASCYPEPYKSSNVVYDFLKKRNLQKTFKTIDFAIFPSQRLFEWYQTMYKIDSNKVKIIPHAVNFQKHGISKTPKSTNTKLIIHAGSLLKPRNPIEFLKVASNIPFVRVELYGNIEKSVYKNIKHFSNSENILLQNERFDYQIILKKLVNADFLLLIESSGKNNPFLPTKFVDYLHLEIPIIALTSKNSEVSRLLGEDYPFTCELNDKASILLILENKILNENLIDHSLTILKKLKASFSKEYIKKAYSQII